MATVNADRNLLFGILAVQMAFISRDALIAAMHAWVLDKDKSLGEILLEQHALLQDTHDLLDALVMKHLEMHGQKAQRSLAAVRSVDSLREELSRIPDRDLSASLAIVSTCWGSAEDPNSTRAPTVNPDTSFGSRFRILRPHARGGLGEVLVAYDKELFREVALKEIRIDHAHDPESRSRFLLEAEITGRLEHPGIVPVYSLGYYADGRPFYAMRFIRGKTLQEAIDTLHNPDTAGRHRKESVIELRKLLGRFLAVCEAIAYAHSRGVLHRDLKPNNIMLGPYGETLVVDWGLAKPMGEPEAMAEAVEGILKPALAGGSTMTRIGATLGTPAYMSPEQAAGRLDRLGPTSDVYSLAQSCTVCSRAMPRSPTLTSQWCCRKCNKENSLLRDGSSGRCLRHSKPSA